MQGQSLQKSPHIQSQKLPYSKWSQHRADNGLTYLSHPATGQVEWLWCRYHDPKTKRDYLFNLISREKQWVTRKNEHFCPVKPSAIISKAKQEPQQQPQPKVSIPQSENRANNPFSSMPSYPNRTLPPKAPPQSNQKPSLKYREILAPKSLALTADEALMLVPETGRRYIFNRKTKSSRWLPDRPPDNSNETQNRRFTQPTATGNSTNHATPQVPIASGITSDEPRHMERNDAQPTEYSAVHNQPNGNIPSFINGHAPAHLNEPVPDTQIPVANEATKKIGCLDAILDDVKGMTSSGKYNMSQLRSLAVGETENSTPQDGSKRLVELEEYLTQQMLKVDAVESDGNQDIRSKRKDVVKTILTLTDEVEDLRKSIANL